MQRLNCLFVNTLFYICTLEGNGVPYDPDVFKVSANLLGLLAFVEEILAQRNIPHRTSAPKSFAHFLLANRPTDPANLEGHLNLRQNLYVSTAVLGMSA